MPVQPDFSNKVIMEKYSSAFSLSDMEIFIFPELLYPLVIANIMSPVIWTWRDDPWFKDIEKKTFMKKILRIKQYIMDNYEFNLDLDTWGLTNKNKEIDRFKDFIDIDILRKSNALFGYEGDKYYFDIDIRRHFGLEKYSGDVIPYWKTETVESMTAFCHKEFYVKGAGECVSLAALYAAALFIVGKVPLENIFMISTPLHSQNFIDIKEGVLTNNRRIVTKRMWFNGTPLSTRARRALENEKVTVVSHISGFIHSEFNKATIDTAVYQYFTESLNKFTSSKLSPDIFTNFLRFHMDFKMCFQYKHFYNGNFYYIPLEKIFEYEHNTKISFSESSRVNLLNEIDMEEFSLAPLENRLIIQDVEEYLEKLQVTDLDNVAAHFTEIARQNNCKNKDEIESLFKEISDFLVVKSQLPSTEKHFLKTQELKINNGLSRQEILQLIRDKSDVNEIALLSLYVYRQMDIINWEPFIKAAMERNPVSIDGLKGKSPDSAYKHISDMHNESIYDSKRLAQPDEVYNFRRGDGIEKAFLFANFLCNELGEKDIKLIIDNDKVLLESNKAKYHFSSTKNIVKQLYLNQKTYN